MHRLDGVAVTIPKGWESMGVQRAEYARSFGELAGAAIFVQLVRGERVSLWCCWARRGAGRSAVRVPNAAGTESGLLPHRAARRRAPWPGAYVTIRFRAPVSLLERPARLCRQMYNRLRIKWPPLGT